MDLEQRTSVGWIATVQRAKDAEFVDVLCNIGKEFAHRQTRLTVLFELPGRFQ
jgi:hypothetical protein